MMSEEIQNQEERFTEEERLRYWKAMEARAAKIKAPKGDPHVVFRAGGKRFALDARNCRGIVPWARPTPLPFMPRHLKGSAFIRGRLVSVTDLAALLGTTWKVAPRFYIIVYERELETLIGVEEVEEVLPVERTRIDETPRSWPGSRIGLVIGQSKDISPTLYLLDAARCLRQVTQATQIRK